jgi:hypothetical protein
MIQNPLTWKQIHDARYDFVPEFPIEDNTLGGNQESQERRAKRSGRFRRNNNNLDDQDNIRRNKKVEKMIKDRVSNKGFTGSDFMDVDSDDESNESRGKTLPNAALNTGIDWEGKRDDRFQKTLREDLEEIQYDDDEQSEAVEDEDELTERGQQLQAGETVERKKKSLRGKRLVLEVDTGKMSLKDGGKGFKNGIDRDDSDSRNVDSLLIRGHNEDDNDEMKQQEVTEDDLLKRFMDDTNPDKFTTLTQV